MDNLQELNVASIADLIDESQHAFLAPAENPDETAADLFTFLKHDSAFRIWGYVKDGKPISYITALSNKEPQTLSVGPMYVAKAHRGEGLGKRQVQEFIRKARNMGYRAIFSKTWAGNNASRAIFEGLGFETTKVKEGDRANGDASIFYRLQW